MNISAQGSIGPVQKSPQTPALPSKPLAAVPVAPLPTNTPALPMPFPNAGLLMGDLHGFLATFGQSPLDVDSLQKAMNITFQGKSTTENQSSFNHILQNQAKESLLDAYGAFLQQKPKATTVEKQNFLKQGLTALQEKANSFLPPAMAESFKGDLETYVNTSMDAFTKDLNTKENSLVAQSKDDIHQELSTSLQDYTQQLLQTMQAAGLVDQTREFLTKVLREEKAHQDRHSSKNDPLRDLPIAGVHKDASDSSSGEKGGENEQGKDEEQNPSPQQDAKGKKTKHKHKHKKHDPLAGGQRNLPPSSNPNDTNGNPGGTPTPTSGNGGSIDSGSSKALEDIQLAESADAAALFGADPMIIIGALFAGMAQIMEVQLTNQANAYQTNLWVAQDLKDVLAQATQTANPDGSLNDGGPVTIIDPKTGQKETMTLWQAMDVLKPYTGVDSTTNVGKGALSKYESSYNQAIDSINSTSQMAMYQLQDSNNRRSSAYEAASSSVHSWYTLASTLMRNIT